MAKWLNIPVIAEGVDKAEQVDFLRSVGCDFIQGFYYAKPMPAKDYEKLISDQEKLTSHETGTSVNDLLWGKGGGLLVSIDNIEQPAMIYECFPDGTVEAVCANKAFSNRYGYDSSMYGKFNVVDCIDSEYKELFTDTINKVIESKGRDECALSMHDINGKKHWFSNHLRYVSETGVSSVIIVYLTDISDIVFMDQRINDYKDYVKNETERSHNILVVSGDEETRIRLGRILSQGNDVFTAESVESGKKQLSENEIDLIYFDIGLISENEAFPLDIDGKKLPVIAIIPSHDELSRRAVLKQRISDFVMRPFIDEIVRSRTANLLKIGITGVANEKFFSRLK